MTPPIDPAPVKPLASKYTWLKTSDEALGSPVRVIAQVMNIADDVPTLSYVKGTPITWVVSGSCKTRPSRGHLLIPAILEP